MSTARTRNLTILLTDLQGFTEKTSRKSRAEVLSMLEKHEEIVLPVLVARGGVLVKTIGDAFLMTFESPTDAVLSGVEVQEALLKYNEGKTGDDRLDVRIAINVGEVSVTKNDIYGEPVNITSRIEALAQAGEVYFSEAVYLAMNKKEVPTSEIGFRKLKGISDEIKLYKVKRERPVEELPSEEPVAAVPPMAPKEKETPLNAATAPRTPSVLRRAIALGVDFLICATIFGIFFKVELPKTVFNRSQKSIHKRSRKVSKGTIRRNKKITGKFDSKPKEDGIKGKVGKYNFEITDDSIVFGGIEVSEERIKVPGIIDIETEKSAKQRNRQKTNKEKYSIQKPAKKVRKRIRVRNKKARQNKLAFPFLWIIYGTFFLTIWGATPGKKFLGLSVISLKSPAAAPLDWETSAIRSFISFFSGSFMMLGFIWGAFNKEGQTVHDLIAKTRVILK
ncbi:MAG: hypothetical protein COB53_06550 [Elusimicrobia bacterium]|nr:MAG: hypothetical protein COB53_06550 [Elusimicrobiota bacterium]